MGSIRSRSDSGLLFFDFRFAGERCREQTALSDTAANRRKLDKVLTAIDSDIAAGTFDYRRYFPNSHNAAKFDTVASFPAAQPAAETPIANPGTATPSATPLFRDFAEIWFAEKEVEWRRSHKTGIRNDLDGLLIPRFGDKEVGRIAKSDILAYRAELAKVPARGKETMLSNRRINKILNPLRMILTEAAGRFDFPMPFQNIKQLKVRRTDVDPFSLDEVKRILETVRSDFRAYFTVRFFTGMRTGEVDGLKWKYVDFERRLILVRETVVAGEEEYTKTDGSQRDIQMSQLVFDALQIQHAATGKLSPWVFCNRAGKPLEHRNVTNRVWRVAAGT